MENAAVNEVTRILSAIAQGDPTPDAAAALGISVATAERWWTFARTWLYSELQEEQKKSADP
jgi:hypothetical protein